MSAWNSLPDSLRNTGLFTDIFKCDFKKKNPVRLVLNIAYSALETLSASALYKFVVELNRTEYKSLAGKCKIGKCGTGQMDDEGQLFKLRME